MRRMLHRTSWTAGGAVTSSAELDHMSNCATPGAMAAEGVRVDEHSLVCCAFSVYQGDKSGQGEARPGVTAMEMWMMPLHALVKTLSLLRKICVTRPNWAKCALMATLGRLAGTPVRQTVVLTSLGAQQ